MEADLVIINGKVITVDPHKIGEIQVLMTIVGGNIAYSKK